MHKKISCAVITYLLMLEIAAKPSQMSWFCLIYYINLQEYDYVFVDLSFE